MSSQLLECIEIQLNEIDALSCILTQQEFCIQTPQSFAALQKISETKNVSATQAFPFSIQLTNFNHDTAVQYKIHSTIKVPLTYPLHEKLEIVETSCSYNYRHPTTLHTESHNPTTTTSSSSTTSNPISKWKEAPSAVNKLIAEHCEEYIERHHSGSEMIFALFQFIATDLHEEVLTCLQRIINEEEKAALDKAQLLEATASAPKEVKITTCCLFFHHIYNEGKKRTIISNAKTYELGGIYKFGKPGRIVIEGLHDNVQSFLQVIKSLNWQKISVRDECSKVYSDGANNWKELTEFQSGFVQVGDDGEFLKELKSQVGEKSADKLFKVLTGLD